MGTNYIEAYLRSLHEEEPIEKFPVLFEALARLLREVQLETSVPTRLATAHISKFSREVASKIADARQHISRSPVSIAGIEQALSAANTELDAELSKLQGIELELQREDELKRQLADTREDLRGKLELRENAEADLRKTQTTIQELESMIAEIQSRLEIQNTDFENNLRTGYSDSLDQVLSLKSRFFSTLGDFEMSLRSAEREIRSRLDDDIQILESASQSQNYSENTLSGLISDFKSIEDSLSNAEAALLRMVQEKENSS